MFSTPPSLLQTRVDLLSAFSLSFQTTNADYLMATGVKPAGYRYKGQAGLVRITVPSGTSNSVLSSAYLGYASTFPNFDGAQVPFKFGAAPGATIPANGSIVSDWLPFKFDATKELIIRLGFSSYNSGEGGGGPNIDGYYQISNSANAGSTSISGGTINSSIRGFSRLELAV